MSAAQFEREVSSQQEEAEYAERIKNKWPCVALWPGKEKTMSAELLKVNVNDHTEKKNNLTYLSWAWAWAEVLKFDSAAIWAVHTYGPQGGEEPYMRVGKTAMVHVSVTIKGLRRECMLPVMDHRNKAIPDPDAFQVNTAIMRCMTKAISMHGLGLYIYAGEDLPEGEDAPPKGLPASIKHSPTDGPIDVSEDRKTMIEFAASIAVDKFKANEKDAAYDVVSAFFGDNEEALYMHTILKPYATLRAYIKMRQESRRQPTQPEKEEEFL
jgi:hypothetical protein